MAVCMEVVGAFSPCFLPGNSLTLVAPHPSCVTTGSSIQPLSQNQNQTLQSHSGVGLAWHFRPRGDKRVTHARRMQEYTEKANAPNKRTMYLSYLDSVKYFQPEVGAGNGTMALRTYVYHEVLLGYMLYAKALGLNAMYIWSCPPLAVRALPLPSCTMSRAGIIHNNV